ncbi:hypothetical protein HYPSUDRAFT_89286, partial [Hypholoma sublateritium FD-334 SS-4]
MGIWASKSRSQTGREKDRRLQMGAQTRLRNTAEKTPSEERLFGAAVFTQVLMPRTCWSRAAGSGVRTVERSDWEVLKFQSHGVHRRRQCRLCLHV